MRTLGTACAIMCACAYQPLHTGELFGGKRVAVLPPRENQPLGIAGILVDDLRRRLAAHGMELTNDVGTADAVLTGEVTSASTAPLPAANGASVASFSTGVAYNAVLADRNGTPLWSGSFRGDDSFILDATQSDNSSQILATEGNRRVALVRVAESIAKQVESSLLRANPIRRPAPPDPAPTGPARHSVPLEHELDMPGVGLPPPGEGPSR